jgi:Protein of unknown function (DUF4232)
MIRRLTMILAGAALAAGGSVAAAGAGAGRAGTPHRCTAADLSARLVDTGGSGAGTLEVGVLFTNTSHTRCALRGFPGLGLLDASEMPIPGYAVFDTTRHASTVVLAPGSSGGARIRYSDVPTGSQTHCRQGAFLLVTPPNGRVPLELRAALAPCDNGRMLVTPVAAHGFGA